MPRKKKQMEKLAGLYKNLLFQRNGKLTLIRELFTTIYIRYRFQFNWINYGKCFFSISCFSFFYIADLALYMEWEFDQLRIFALQEDLLQVYYLIQTQKWRKGHDGWWYSQQQKRELLIFYRDDRPIMNAFARGTGMEFGRYSNKGAWISSPKKKERLFLDSKTWLENTTLKKLYQYIFFRRDTATVHEIYMRIVFGGVTLIERFEWDDYSKTVISIWNRVKREESCNWKLQTAEKDSGKKRKNIGDAHNAGDSELPGHVWSKKRKKWNWKARRRQPEGEETSPGVDEEEEEEESNIPRTLIDVTWRESFENPKIPKTWFIRNFPTPPPRGGWETGPHINRNPSNQTAPERNLSLYLLL